MFLTKSKIKEKKGSYWKNRAKNDCKKSINTVIKMNRPFHPTRFLAVAILLGVFSRCLPGSEAGKVSLDMSEVLHHDNQMILYTYNVLSHLDHLATNKFKLKLSPKALQKLNFLDNITEVGVSYDGMTELPNNKLVSEQAFKSLEGTLSEDTLFLLKALSKKSLGIPLVLKPADGDIEETIGFMDAFKEYWTAVDKVASMQVEQFDPSTIPLEVKDSLALRTKLYDTQTKRRGRLLNTPELPLQVSQEHLRTLLTNVFIHPRNHGTNESQYEKEVIRAFITKTFEDFGLDVYNHEFSAHETEYLYGEQVIGTNVIGVLPGDRWGTPEDAPVIIGAHYDTVTNTTGTIDNASGTSAVIEAARMLTASQCHFRNSVFFVAFDLEEIGTQGSFMFVKDFLLKLLFPTYGIKSIGGALILDCIGNWDQNNGTQEVPDAWEEKVDGLKKKIEERDNAGDFLAVMYRQNPDSVLAKKIEQYYNGLGEPKYRLEMMSLRELHKSRPNDTTNLENFDFFRSDHYRFWYPSQETPNVSFPALLLTDTGPYRGKMSTCYHASCDTMEIIEPNLNFMSKIIKAVAWVAADLAAASCGPRGIFKVPEMFLVAKDRLTVEPETEEDVRPIVTIDGVVEILKYLGQMDIENFKSIRQNSSEISDSSVLFKNPIHRFSIPQKMRENRGVLPTKADFSNSKLTILIHGKNSTYLIPLKLSHTPPPTNFTSAETNKSSTESPTPNRASNSAPKNAIEHNITTSLKVA